MFHATIFMTGGTGLIGQWTAARLTADGEQVLILARQAKERLADYRSWIDRHGGRGENVEFIEGDLSKTDLGIDQTDLSALNKVHKIYHMGASFSWNLTKDAARKVNVEGTVSLLALAQKLPCLDRFVLISGYMVAASERWAPFGLEKPSDLSAMPVTQPQLDKMYRKLGSYEASKLEADILTRKICGEKNIPLTIINPATVIGSAETGELDQQQGLGALVQAIWRKMFTAIPGQKSDWIPLISIDYLSAFLAKAPMLTETQDKEYTLLDEQTPRAGELIGIIATHMGRAAPRKYIPKSLMAFLLNAGLSKFTGTSAESLSFLEPFSFDTGPANKIGQQLDLEKSNIQAAIFKTVDYFAATHFGRSPSAFKAGTTGYANIEGHKTFLGGDREKATHVYLHGLPLNSDSWAPVIEQVREPALFADLPGLGRSTVNGSVDHTAWLRNVCSDLQAPSTIVAHSLGTGFAIDYACAYPERVKGLILIAPYFLQTRPGRNLKFTFTHSDMKNLLTGSQDIGQDVVDSAYLSLKNPGGMRSIGRYLGGARQISHRQIYGQRLKSLNMPVLLISGEYDPLVEPTGKHQSVEILGAGHFPQTTHSKEVAMLINEFPT